MTTDNGMFMENTLMSDQIDQLALALAKAQGEFLSAKKDKDNPFFKSKYADLEAVVEATRPALSKNGLSVVQSVFRMDDTHTYLVTLLLHASGQWIKSKAQINPQKADIQSLKSYNTYLRRICYESLVGVTTGDEDDDGHNASHSPAPNYYKKENFPGANIPHIDDQPGLNEEQLSYLLTLSPAWQANILTFNKVARLEDLSPNQYKRVVATVESKKNNK
jgi:hypothetical protein